MSKIIKIKREESKKKISSQIEKGEFLFQNGIEIKKSNNYLQNKSRYDDKFKIDLKIWTDITFEILTEIFVLREYAHNFHNCSSSKTKYISSSWVPDIQYYIEKQLVPKIDYLRTILDHLEEFDDTLNDIQCKDVDVYSEKECSLMNSKLDPWTVICGNLFEFDSYNIPQIIDKTGMKVDWSLTERENYSQKYRKDVFRLRINSAYNSLSDDDKLRVLFIVTTELKVNKDALNENLEKIGWKIEDDRLVPTKKMQENYFFPKIHNMMHMLKLRKSFKRSKKLSKLLIHILIVRYSQ